MTRAQKDQLIKKITQTLARGIGNSLVPLGFFTEKIVAGNKLTAQEKKMMQKSLMDMERMLNKIRKLDVDKLEASPCRSDRHGFLKLLEI